MKTHKAFFISAGVVFTFAGLLHLIRSIMRWDLIVGNYYVPIWLSVVAVIITWDLAFNAFKFAKKK